MNDSGRTPPDVTSRQNPRIKQLVRMRDRGRRARGELTLIDGAREIARALAAGVPLVEAYCCWDAADADEARHAWRAVQTQCPVCLTVSREVYEKIRYGQRCDGLVAVARVPHRRLDELTLPERPLIAVMEGVQKPGNLGAVLRSADGAGIDAVVAADAETDLFNPHAIRASMGAVFKPNVAAADVPTTLAWLQAAGVPLVAAVVDASMTYDQFDYRQGAAIVLGSEAEGLSSAWRTAQVTGVRLPMLGVADSLNVSAAAAVLFYEARRQRSLP